MADSPTSRSLKELRKRGYTAQVVERYCPYAKRRIDLFSVIDIVGIRADEVVGIQATSRAHVSDRIKKIQTCQHYEALQASPIEVWVWGWGKLADKKWHLREELVA